MAKQRVLKAKGATVLGQATGTVGPFDNLGLFGSLTRDDVETFVRKIKAIRSDARKCRAFVEAIVDTLSVMMPAIKNPSLTVNPAWRRRVIANTKVTRAIALLRKIGVLPMRPPVGKIRIPGNHRAALEKAIAAVTKAHSRNIIIRGAIRG